MIVNEVDHERMTIPKRFLSPIMQFPKKTGFLYHKEYIIIKMSLPEQTVLQVKTNIDHY